MEVSSDDNPSGRLAAASSLQAHLFALKDIQDRPYSEALFTTFNLDLGFFEQRVLGLVRASGAAVTVIADGSRYEPDPVAVHSAGSSYRVGVVDLATAFHPKVSVLVGSEHFLVAVGSGNLTAGGWFSNEETLFVASGSRDEGIPAVVADVNSWLGALAGLRMSEGARQSVQRVHLAIGRLLEAGPVVETGQRLVTTSIGPILDQLPNGPVDELLLYAPFHDHSGAALAALLDRYTPSRVNIAVQPGKTILDPNMLTREAAARSVELVWHDAGHGYRHGKLIEAVTDGSRWVLAGSPNLTGAALLRGLASGGNCEVGVVTTTPRSLYPGDGPALETAAIPVTRILTPPGELPSTGTSLPILLGATLDGDGVLVELSRPAPLPVQVEVSEYNDQPQLSSLLGHVATGQASAHLVPDRPLGARSRLRLRYDLDGSTVRGPTHFLSDPDAVVHRIPPRRSTANNVDVNWQSLFGDLALLEAWTRTLDHVTREHHAAPRTDIRTPTTDDPAAAGRPSSHRTFDDEEAWARYSQDAIARLGPTLAHEASGGLILPHLSTSISTKAAVGVPAWADKFDADEADFDDEHTAEELDANTDADDATDQQGTTELVTVQQQRRFRSWVTRLVTDIENRPTLDRLTLTRLILIASLAPVWDDEAGWFPSLHNATSGLRNDDVPDLLQAELASLAAVCLFRLDQGAPPDRRTGTGRQYAQLVDRLRPILDEVDAERVDVIVRSIYGSQAATTLSRAVMDHLEAAAAMNPWPEITRLLQREHPDWEVDLEDDGRLMIEARSGAPFKVAAHAMEQVPSHLSVGIVVYAGRRPERRRYARHQDILVAEDYLGPRQVWKTYQLSALVSPTGIQANQATEAAARIDKPPWMEISQTAHHVLTSVGLGTSR
ncbi:hypothetical protein [Myceligenerans xiligouense]|uniref:Uncharacterized protein n=1 Tax=Myceligenerans xiligouense TaxID=253184 RepID=A0A3N4Z7L8_9MICO|nr:hypothetical protein [Myceligenerans xiligouense]RPF21322.1 hypothetical protein EDD34_1949 [Myceligenerans xiligouense]